MSFEVVVDRAKWENFLSSFSREQADIYFSHQYVAAYQQNGDGEACCAIYTGRHGMKVLYPFLKAAIPDYGLASDYYDLISCYGYAGPLIANYNFQDMTSFEKNLHLWCIENRVVAEFIRFHPLFYNHDKFTCNMTIHLNRQTVCVDLSLSRQNLWEKSLTAKNRNQVRKALKCGLKIKESTDWPAFVSLYLPTMQKVKARPEMYFSQEYFHELFKLIPENMVILEALFKDQVIASSLFIFMGDKMHYHLSGSLQSYLHLCPNNLLLYQAIEFGIKNGLRCLHLGGGNSNHPDDPLFKFKQSFSPQRKDFYVGKRVHNNAIYRLLMKKWEEKDNQKPKLFLQYRYI